MLMAYGLDLTAGTELEVNEELMVDEKRPVSRRKMRPSKIAIDWSQNEMSAPEYFKAGMKETTPCHLYIDHEGEIWQFADVMAEHVHRSGLKLLDERCIWIVLQNKGLPPADSRVKRGVWTYSFGRFNNLAVLGALQDQLDALAEVIGLLCDSMDLDPTIPRKDGEPYLTALTRETAIRWSGLALASHLSDATVSPGPGVLEVLEEIEDEWFSDDEEDDEDDEDEDGEPVDVDEEQFENDFPEPSA